MTTGAPNSIEAELALLTGEAADELIAAVLAPTGGELLRWSATQVDHQPGDGTTVGYSARVRWADGTETDERLGARAGSLPDGVAVLSDGRHEIGMWRFPFDPALPALSTAWDTDSTRQLLRSAGLDPDGADVALRVRAYRPMRRAVIEVRGSSGRVFIKVVPPAKARRLHERHRIASAAELPVPAPLGWTDEGLVVLSALPGRTLRHVLLGTGPVELDGDGVVDLLDRLPPELATGRRRRTWGQKAPHYASVIGGVLPSMTGRAHDIAAAVDHDLPEGPGVPVHGDFYESQLMVAGGRLTGLLDIDTAGLGERLDDAGCLLAHLAVLAQIHPARGREINQLGSLLERHLSRDLDRAALARRTAAVVLSLATGPHRVQEPGWQRHTAERIALAEQWLDFAASRAANSTEDNP